MSKEVEPDTLVTLETDVEYSEILELTTVSEAQQQEIVLKPPPQFSETEFGTYISMEEARMQRPSTSRSHFDEEPYTSRQASTFHTYSTVEDAEVIQYENFIHGRCPQEEDVEPRFANNIGYDGDISDDILSLRTRLKIKKRRLPFIAYAFYAAEEVYQEVEKILLLDIVFLVFSLGVASVGMTRVTDCTVSPNIPVIIVVSGVVDAVVNVLSISASLTRRPSLKEGLHDITRMGRLTLFFIHTYGLAKVYSILPPEESDHFSLEYCDSVLYWTTFAFFHITTLSSLIVFAGMATAVACFYV
ncbi:uncharacterized protein LOC129985135 [Argiope bruennichi]|uniref:uncharacterized protein LOC129985135 n=1 Tax=Argiope bruennichi TaxID=94029 RepID=UPI00249494B4|nr:uncharacterized protein LOC129985135 [Argiope bruennichi]